MLCSNDLKKNNKLYDPGGGMSRVELIAIECDEPAGRHSNFKSCKKKKKNYKKNIPAVARDADVARPPALLQWWWWQSSSSCDRGCGHGRGDCCTYNNKNKKDINKMK